MPPRSRSGPTYQHMPWASGARKAPPSGRRPKKKQTPWARLRKKGRKFAGDHPMVSLIAAVAFGIAAVVCMALGLVLENVLYYLAVVVAGLGAAASRRAMRMAQQRHYGQDRPVRKPAAARPTPRPTTATASPEAQPSNEDGAPPKVIKCTRTGKPTGECDCSTRGHVVSAEGLRRYGGAYGDPLGARKKPAP